MVVNMDSEQQRERLHSLGITTTAKDWQSRVARIVARRFLECSDVAAKVTSELERQYWLGAAAVYDGLTIRYRVWEYLLHRRESSLYVRHTARCEARKATVTASRQPNIEARLYHEGRRDAWRVVYRAVCDTMRLAERRLKRRQAKGKRCT